MERQEERSLEARSMKRFFLSGGGTCDRHGVGVWRCEGRRQAQGGRGQRQRGVETGVSRCISRHQVLELGLGSELDGEEGSAAGCGTRRIDAREIVEVSVGWGLEKRVELAQPHLRSTDDCERLLGIGGHLHRIADLEAQESVRRKRGARVPADGAQGRLSWAEGAAAHTSDRGELDVLRRGREWVAMRRRGTPREAS